MNNPEFNFFDLLTENNYSRQCRDIPEEFEHTDELLADIEMDGSIPDSMMYFELNGFKSPVDLEELLARQFNAFKLFFVSSNFENNENVLNEIKNQVTKIQDELYILKQSAIPFGDITFESLINLKIQYSNELLQFILNKNVNNTNQEVNKLKVVNPVYIFKINDTVEKRRCDEILFQLHTELKKYGYIDCSLPDFRKLFLQPEKKMPFQTPQPIVWKGKKYNHLAYFIKCISGTLINSTIDPSNYEIALNLFYNSQEENKFNPRKLRFDGRINQNAKDVFDRIMKILDLPKKKVKS